VHVVALLLGLAALPITYVVSETFSESARLASSGPTANESASPTIVPTAARPNSAGQSARGPKFAQLDLGRDAIEPDHSVTKEPNADRQSPTRLAISRIFVAAYLIGVGLMLVRLAVSASKAERIRYVAKTISDGPIVDTLQKMARRWSMRATPVLAQAELVLVPKVIGLLRPTILLPTSMLTGLTAGELELILAHELAHIRRHDMWVNLLQRFAEATLFFNPALWYLSRRTSALREYCCDELACQLVQTDSEPTRVRYARTLLRVVEIASVAPQAADAAALAVTGRTPSELRRRMARLFGEPLLEPLQLTPGGTMALILMVVALAVGPSVLYTHAASPEADLSAEDTDNSVEDGDSFVFRLNVIDPSGAAVPQAEVEVRTSPAPTAEQIQRGVFLRRSNYGAFAKTDDQGRLAIILGRQPERFNLSIRQFGYGPYWASWDSSSHPQSIPHKFTAQLDAGWSVGGVVVDEADEPVEGATVRPSIEYKKRPGDTQQLGMGTRIATDANGKWRCDCVPASMDFVAVAIDHPDYQPWRERLPRSDFEIKQNVQPLAPIRLSRGESVTGVVTDESDQPIEGALVRAKFFNEIREARTDKQGVYRLVGCEPRMSRIVVSASGRATDMQEVRVSSTLPPVNFALKPGGKIRIRVVDEQGNGVPKARIFFQRWRGPFEYFEFDHVNQYTDKNGVWEWNEAPLDGIEADICRPDGMQLSRQPLIARSEEYVFAPPAALVVSGHVIDAVTKEPVKRFRVIPGLRNRDPRIGMNWIPRDSFDAVDGEYQIRLQHAYLAHLVRIEAPGYQVAISRDIMTNEGNVSIDFELQPAADIVAVIETSDGKPAAHAKLALGVAGSQISIDEGEINDGSTYATRLDADADGHFSIPARDEPFQLVVTHPAGFAHLKSVDGPIPDRITLTPWARVEGTFRVGAAPAPNVVLSIFSEGIHSYGDNVPNVFTSHDVTTNKDGRFVAERVFPGSGRIGRRILLMVDEGATEVTSSQRVSADFVAGKTTQLNIGGTGRPVIGKLIAPTGDKEPVLWNFALVEVSIGLIPPPRPTPPADVQNNQVRLKEWWDAWQATDEGLNWNVDYAAFEQLKRQYPYVTASVDQDGNFRIDDLPPGYYVLRVRFDRKAPGVLSGYHFTVPAMEVEYISQPLDLGSLTLESR
jgi:beta-lactamase regulating signal transducer with metallopeptidase domain/uncharacterized GH25 family protein